MVHWLGCCPWRPHRVDVGLWLWAVRARDEAGRLAQTATVLASVRTVASVTVRVTERIWTVAEGTLQIVDSFGPDARVLREEPCWWVLDDGAGLEECFRPEDLAGALAHAAYLTLSYADEIKDDDEDD